MHIFQWVIVHRFGKLDGIEHLDPIPVVPEEVTALRKGGAFGIRQEIAGIELHEVGFDVVARLTRTGTTDDHDV